jgi:hypothetical protein
MDKKRVLIIGAGVMVVGGFAMWFRKYEANKASASNNAQSTDAQLAELMMQSPLPYGGSSEPASVSGPSIDTGNTQLQSIINSVLHPPAPPPSVDTRHPIDTQHLPPSSLTPQPYQGFTYSPDGSNQQPQGGITPISNTAVITPVKRTMFQALSVN